MEKYTSHARFASVHDFYVLFFVECIELTFVAQNMYYNSVCCHKIRLDQIFTSLGMKSFSLNEPCNAILPAKLKRDILPAQLVPMIYLRTILPILALSIQFNFFRRRTSLLNKDTKKYVFIKKKTEISIKTNQPVLFVVCTLGILHSDKRQRRLHSTMRRNRLRAYSRPRVQRVCPRR